LSNSTHLRGTFHNHTTASDGNHTLEEMAEEAMELGLQYLGIADHSKSMVIANGLDEERLLNRSPGIRALNATFTHFRIFAGSEVDILKDGSLDFDDETLARLDYCVASVHNIFNLPEDEMTRRICRAMENEHVTMLGHLTGRLLLKRDGYAVDHAMIIDCAAETRTDHRAQLQSHRLDMDWRWWKRARDKGVLCSINPDAHSTMACTTSASAPASPARAGSANRMSSTPAQPPRSRLSSKRPRRNDEPRSNRRVPSGRPFPESCSRGPQRSRFCRWRIPSGSTKPRWPQG
jgi:histidinol phosphatase-like PHP family hydrolase